MAQVSTAKDKINGKQSKINFRRVHKGQKGSWNLFKYSSNRKIVKAKDPRIAQHWEEKSVWDGQHSGPLASSNQITKAINQPTGEDCDGARR